MESEVQSLAAIAGTVGGMLSIGAFLPQAYRIFQRRSAVDVSLAMYVTIVVACVLWMFYAYVHASVAVVRHQPRHRHGGRRDRGSADPLRQAMKCQTLSRTKDSMLALTVEGR
jgi:uncharacterized protein with PQ loop repeat